MKPLEEVADIALFYEYKLNIPKMRFNFVYSPYDKETLAAIESYFAKCSKIFNYKNLDICLIENHLIEGEEEKKVVTSLEIKKLCKKYNMHEDDNIRSKPIKMPDDSFTYYPDEYLEKYGGKWTNGSYSLKCEFAKSGFINLLKVDLSDVKM